MAQSYVGVDLSNRILTSAPFCDCQKPRVEPSLLRYCLLQLHSNVQIYRIRPNARRIKPGRNVVLVVCFTSEFPVENIKLLFQSRYSKPFNDNGKYGCSLSEKKNICFATAWKCMPHLPCLLVTDKIGPRTGTVGNGHNPPGQSPRTKSHPDKVPPDKISPYTRTKSSIPVRNSSILSEGGYVLGDYVLDSVHC